MGSYRKFRSAVGAAIALAAALALAPSASAVVETWHNTGTASFTGYQCDDVSQVVLYIPSHVSRVSVAGPHRGQKLVDRTTGQVVATITSVQRTGTGVTYTATGTDDACANPDRYADSGWQTKPVQFRATWHTHAHVLYPSACNNPSFRPTRILIACGDGTFYVDRIRWSKWNDGSARGTGTAHVNDCKPNCAAGHFHAYPGVSVELGYPSFCRAHVDYEFTRLRYRFTGARPAGFAQTGFARAGCAPSRPSTRSR